MRTQKVFSLVLAALVGAAQAARAETTDVEASAAFVAPVSILSAEPLTFGQLAVPASGECTYTLSPTGSVTASGGGTCAFIDAKALAARFEIGCGQSGAAVRYEITYINAAPAGSTFEAPANPVRIDAAQAGGLSQVRPCDTDGISVVSAGGQLRVSASAPRSFKGRVGTIRLEAVFE